MNRHYLLLPRRDLLIALLLCYQLVSIFLFLQITDYVDFGSFSCYWRMRSVWFSNLVRIWRTGLDSPIKNVNGYPHLLSPSCFKIPKTPTAVKQGWHSGESTRLPTTSVTWVQTQHHMWVEFCCWFSALLWELFIQVQYPDFPSPQKPSIKFPYTNLQ